MIDYYFNKTIHQPTIMSSICIPRIDTNIPKDYIINKLCNLQIGTIQKFTEIPLKNDPTHKRILITIVWNKKNQKALNIQNTLETHGSIKLVHDMPWYWKIVPAYSSTNMN